MNDPIELLRDYYETSRLERDMKWRYDQHPARKASDKEKRWKIYNEWDDARNKRWDLDEKIESYLMTRAPRTGA